MMFKKVLAVIAAVQIVGCSTAYNHSEAQAPSAQLDSSKGVLISVPEDGLFEGEKYKNSGTMTAEVIQESFSKFAVRADITSDCKNEECLADINKEKYGYFVQPVIHHWEERATEWSGIPDRIEIQIVIFESAMGSQIADSSFTGKSKWATMGGDHPQDLLPEPTNDLVTRLYE